MVLAALYDADVLLPHETRDILMISASTRSHKVFWSEDIFEEWLRNAVKKNLTSKENVLRIQAIMNQMFPDALLAHNNFKLLIDSLTNDPKDRHVLAAAIVSNCSVIVTRNTKHFPQESVSKYKIEVQTPDEFVKSQASLNPLPFIEKFLTRAHERNRQAMLRGRMPLEPEDIALFLRDGPSEMPETGELLLNLLRKFPKH
jgi:predicted nucleic acid-binding protein